MSRSTVRSARPLARRAVLLAVAGAGAASLLAGCSTGQITQTSTKVPSVPGINTNAGDIAIRNAVVTYPPEGSYESGADAPLDMRLINLRFEPETLTGATSEDAASVEIRPGSAATPEPTASPAAVPVACASPVASLPPDLAPESPTATPAESPAETASPAPTATATVPPGGAATPSAPAGATPTATASPEPTAPAAQQSIVIPPSCLVAVGPTAQQQLLLTGLERDLISGDLVTVTLEFERAGQVTLRLPVAPAPSALSRSPLPLEEEGHEGEEGAAE